MPVAVHLAMAFKEAHRAQRDIWARWREVAPLGFSLPNSLLFVSIQDVGQLDVLIRSIEAECAAALSAGGDWPVFSNEQTMLANLWIGSSYELVRLLVERGIGSQPELLSPLKWDLSLIRMTVEKHEIAGGKKVGVLDLVPIPREADEPVQTERYDPVDPMRSFIANQGFSQRGSHMWQPYDHRSGKMRWLERQQLADRLLDALQGNLPPAPSS